jgi:hypothetical protein
MLLLPGSLPPDAATLKALCAGLATHSEIAERLRGAAPAPFDGSWSDAERTAYGLSGDLTDGAALAQYAETTLARQVNVAGSNVSTYAVATPLHAALGLTDLSPIDPSALLLTTADSQAFCEAAHDHLNGEGLQLQFVDANRWLLRCPRPMDIRCERPDWLIGESLRPNLPRGNDARTAERWMNELQMLLYTHPVNIAREDRGLPPVNVVWLWGFSDAHSSTHEPPALHHLPALRNGDVASWQRAWGMQQMALLAAETIILGDSRPRLRLDIRKPSTASRFTRLFQRKPKLADVLLDLQKAL